jgi:SAM-dependent methyltransferase
VGSRFSNSEAATLSGERVGFSFGANWRRYAESITDEQIQQARRSLVESFAHHGVAEHDFLDIGSGSGLFSYCAFLERARSILSVDVDPNSIATTEGFVERAGAPASWKVQQGSILDDGFRRTIPLADRVYSWGVLHHTGAMWEAVAAALELVAPNGLFCLALYTRPRFLPVHMALKRTYNRLPGMVRPALTGGVACAKLGKRVFVHRQNPLSYVRGYGRSNRGMSFWRDIEDWLGGLPFEFTSTDEVTRFVERRGFAVERVIQRAPGANDELLLRRIS